MGRNLFFAASTPVVDAIVEAGSRTLLAPGDEPWLELHFDRTFALGQARVIARRAPDGTGWLVRCSVSDDVVKEWAKCDWREGEVDESDRDSLFVNAEDLSDFSHALEGPIEIVGAYE